ncbi:MAG: alcohol dehydrogenase catalytic domain-containing protein [Bacteroidales bacterium]|nr:alcohol dehydrogenase catalytic domain-containing protein [Bacteroidales bacterium]
MKSMMLTGIRQMEMKEVPVPDIKNDTDVLIRMKRLGVCGSDIHYYTTGRIGSQVVSYPFPVGHEGAGIVEKSGTGVTRVKPGDRIAIEPAMPCGYCDQCLAGRPHTCRNLRFLGCPGQADGCLSEYIVIPEGSCIPIADNLTLDHASLSEPLAIGVYAVQQSVPMKDAHIGILGFGPIGMSVLLPSIARGATKAYITDKIDERLQLAGKAGAFYTGNPDKQNIVKEIIQQEPLLLDVVFECCGKQEAIDQAVHLLKPGGKLMIIGIPEFDRWSLDASEIRRKEICIQNVRRQNHCTEETLDMIASGALNTDNMITHRFPFEKTWEAFEMVAGYEDGVMKAMIEFG